MPVPSTTNRRKLNCPATVGVPVNFHCTGPVWTRLKPGGRNVNGSSVHVSVPGPPVATRSWLYGEPTNPFGKLDDVWIATNETVSWNRRTSNREELAASVALTRNVYVPVVTELPDSRPPLESVNPDGNAPPTTDHVTGTQHAESWVE